MQHHFQCTVNIYLCLLRFCVVRFTTTKKKKTKERDAKMVQWTSTLSYSALGTRFRGKAIPTVVMNWFNDATLGSGQFFWPWAPHPKPGQLSSWKQRSVSECKQLAQGKSSPGFLEGKLHSLLSQISGLSASTCGCQHALVSPFMYYLSFFSLIYTMRMALWHVTNPLRLSRNILGSCLWP